MNSKIIIIESPFNPKWSKENSNITDPTLIDRNVKKYIETQKMSEKHTKTLKLRVKDKHCKMLEAQACEVNFVWNYVNDLSMKILEREGRFASAYDLDTFTSGASKEGLSLHSQTIQAITAEYVTRRKQFKKKRLNWRVSNPNSAKKSLGWIPFKKSAISFKNGQLKYQGKHIKLWDSYGLENYELGTGSFSQDSLGRWYINITVKFTPEKFDGDSIAVGTDPGCKDAFTMSDGTKVHGNWYRGNEAKIAKLQSRADKARNKNQKKGKSKAKQLKRIQARTKNRRKDAIHKETTRQARKYYGCFVGNVSSKAMSKTRMAKGSLDAGWGMFKSLLETKCRWAGSVFAEIDEKYSTQTCSACGVIPESSPKGLSGLKVRQWVCDSCGTIHDRDINGAENIRKRGIDLHLKPVQDIAR